SQPSRDRAINGLPASHATRGQPRRPPHAPSARARCAESRSSRPSHDRRTAPRTNPTAPDWFVARYVDHVMVAMSEILHSAPELKERGAVGAAGLWLRARLGAR